MIIGKHLERILIESDLVNQRFQSMTDEELSSFSCTFNVPENHPRALDGLESYELRVGNHAKVVEDRSGTLTLVDRDVEDVVAIKGIAGCSQVSDWETCTTIIESEEKEKSSFSFGAARAYYGDKTKFSRVVAVGGGMICNLATSMAERDDATLTLVPTTLLAMADCSGGKARLNIGRGNHWKHFYRSYYEPDEIVVDTSFLNVLPKAQIGVGMSEVIKHGLFQSQPLFEYIMEAADEIMPNKVMGWKKRDVKPALKAALWAADLKRVCLEIDHEEQAYGSGGILRAGHFISDRLEEHYQFHVPHGEAVAVGIMKDLYYTDASQKLRRNAREAFTRFGLPTKEEELEKKYEKHCSRL